MERARNGATPSERGPLGPDDGYVPAARSVPSLPASGGGEAPLVRSTPPGGACSSRPWTQLQPPSTRKLADANIPVSSVFGLIFAGQLSHQYQIRPPASGSALISPTGPVPAIVADVVCWLGARTIFHSRRFGLSLVPDR
jgi:hypothetical protein